MDALEVATCADLMFQFGERLPRLSTPWEPRPVRLNPLEDEPFVPCT